MAQLKSTVVQGSLRVTDSIYTNELQTKIIQAPTDSNGTAYGVGTNGQVLKSNGTHVYWAAESGPVTGVKGNSESSYRTGQINITAANIGLGNVENTKLSTWTGTGNIATVGTITSGTWKGTVVDVAHGGTGTNTFTSGNLLIGNGTGAIGTRQITNNTSNTAVTASTNIPTMNTLYYGLVTVNGASQTRATGIYAPTGAGTSGQYLKSSGSTPTWNNITYPDIEPTVSKIYAPANSYGATDAEATCCFFFISVKPDSWYKGWQVRFKVRTVADSYANVDSTTWCTLNGRADSFIYHNWNERYDIGHYYIVARALKSAGFNAGLGHMVGVNVRYSTGRGNTAYTRKIYLDYYDCEGCTVTVLDNANIWENLGNTTNYSDTNYNGYTNLDAVNRGLRETGDDNSTSISHLYEQYGGWVAANALYRYQFVFENIDHKFISIFGTDNAYGTTNKTLLTTEFNPNGRIFYHNTSGTTAANANIDPGRLYYAVLADLRYSFNVTSTASATTFTGVRYTSLYLKTQMNNSNGMVHIVDNQPLTTVLPTTNDGYYYIYLGQVHDWYRVMMTGEHPVYYHNGQTLVQYLGKTLGGNLIGTATNVTGTVAIANGGTGETTAAEAWTNLGGGDSGKHAENYYALAGHTHAANAVIKTASISWSNVATYTYSDSWVTASTAIVATDLQYKKPAAMIEWVISAGNIVFTCSAACSASFSIMMLKQA